MLRLETLGKYVCGVFIAGKERAADVRAGPTRYGEGGWLFTVGNRKPKQFRFRSKFGYSFHLLGLKPESPYGAQ